MKELCMMPVAGGRYGLGDWHTHLPVLITALSRTQPNTILELGAGDYSTMLFHAYARGTRKVKVTSLENDFNSGWLDGLSWMRGPNHDIVKVDGWDYTAYPGPYDLVFIDQGPEPDRIPAFEFYHDKAGVVVLHDCNYRNRYMATLEKMAYVAYDRTHRFHTVVASNTVDVTKWFAAEVGVTAEPSWPVASINA